MPAAFIDDGYTCEKTFDGVYGGETFHDPVKVEFRPLLPREVQRVSARISSRLSDEKLSEDRQIDDASDIGDKAIASQLVDWDLHNSGGTPVAITAANVGRLESHLRGAMLELILGIIPPDSPQADPKN